jgi:hypothetical protein
VGRFGIDIWMTTKAIKNGARIGQARLGSKLHDPKDPRSLGGMFRDVVSTMMTIADRSEEDWRSVKGSRDVPLVGREPRTPVQRFDIDRERLLLNFTLGLRRFRSVWRTILGERTVRRLTSNPRRSVDRFHIPLDLWAKIVFDFTLAFHYWTIHRLKVVDLMEPLYFAQVVSYANMVRDVSDDEAERKIEEIAEAFETQKPYLVRRWGRPRSDGELPRFKTG